jgi:hypothetical protein
VIENLPDDRSLGDEGDDPHLATALRASFETATSAVAGVSMLLQPKVARTVMICRELTFITFLRLARQ